MSVKDVIKKSILELSNFSSSYTPQLILSILSALVVALLFGLVINLVYTKFYKGVVYNRTFSITLVGMTVLTTMVTLAISTNIVISLGMVGALSIVRFRTPVKDPLDMLYLFWAITTGITVGAYMYPLAVLAAVIIILMILIMTRRSAGGRTYIAIVHYSSDLTGDDIRLAMGKINYRIKSKTLKGELCELAMEVFSKGESMIFVDRLRAVKGVEDVTVIQYDGEYHE